jgi:hypothetical protein
VGSPALAARSSSVMCWTDSEGMALRISEKKLAPIRRHARPKG